MRHMATGAALGLYWQVFEYERPFRIVVTLEANLILGPTGSQLPGQHRPVRVVTVVAGDQLLVDAMPIWPAEFGTLLGVALIAKKWCLLDQQRPLGFCVVRRMTIQAANSIRRVRRARKICVLRTQRMAGQATGASILHAEILETDNFRNIAASLHVCRTRAMARFASVPFHCSHFLTFCQQIAVRSELQLVEHFFMAVLTRLRSDILSAGVGRRRGSGDLEPVARQKHRSLPGSTAEKRMDRNRSGGMHFTCEACILSS